MNSLANKQLGCEGWTNQKYIDIWCGGDASAEARRIDFTYIPYSSLSDYEVSARQVSEAIANTPQTRIRHRQGSHGEKIKNGVPVPSYQSTRTPEPSRHHIFPVQPYHQPANENKLREQDKHSASAHASVQAAITAEREHTKQLTAAEFDRVSKLESAHTEENRRLLKLLEDSHKQMFTQQQEMLAREQKLMDDVRREERATKQSKREAKQMDKHREFMLAVLANPTFSAASSNSALLPALSAMMTFHRPVDGFAVQSTSVSGGSPPGLTFAKHDEPSTHFRESARARDSIRVCGCETQRA